MYELIFDDCVLSFHSLHSWQKRVIQLQSVGKNYFDFERTPYGWRFFFKAPLND